MSATPDKLDASLVQRAAPAGSMRYFAWLYAPEALRDVLAAVLLIDAELRDSARTPHDVAHVRLQWWREEIERLSSHRAQHPATRIIQSRHLARVDIERLQYVAVTAAQDLANSTFETDVELNSYLQNGNGALFMFAVQCLSAVPPSPALLDAAQQLGAFVRQTEIVRDLRADLHHGRLYLPLAELDSRHIEYEMLQNAEWPPAFVEWLKRRCEQQLRTYHELKRALLDSERIGLRPLWVLSELHARLLEKIMRDPVKQTQQRLDLGAFEKPWTAWRAARAAS